MNKISGSVVLLLVLSLFFAGCAQRKGAQLREERLSHLELQNSVKSLTDKVAVLNKKISLISGKQNVEGLIGSDKPEELEVVEAEGENDLDAVSRADTDISETPPVDEAKEEIVKVRPEKIPAGREPDGLDGLEIIEGEEGDFFDITSIAETDIFEAPQADEAKEEIVKVKPIILASIGIFSSNRKKQTLKDVYEDAYNLYKRGDFRGAISAFSSFIVNHPSTSYTDNAFYWRGECHYALGEFRKAIDEFDLVEKKFPKGNKAPDAMLKKGYSYFKINNIPQAKNSFQKVMELYPSSSAAEKAAEKINLL